jgi:hypothetical protein
LERGRLARFVFFAGGTPALHYEKHLSSSRVAAIAMTVDMQV